MAQLSRRDLLSAAAAGIMLPTTALLAPNPKRKRALRFAHLTDSHVQPERGATEGLIACLRHAQSQKDKPQMVFTGGDLIMDSFGADATRTKTQWDLFLNAFKDHCDLPVEHTIGNHDVWGWGRGDEFAKDARFGKQWACDLLEYDAPYRFFDRNGWRFIVLDSTYRQGNGYTAKLDDKQFAWLEAVLEKTDPKMPIMVMSHIPILAVAVFFDGENEKSGNWQVPGSWMHIDARKIKDLFKKYPNVKLCLSGHLHLVDSASYHGVTYCCNGAVSAAWWGGDYHECTYGYALIDLYDDGSFENHYVPFGWKTQK